MEIMYGGTKWALNKSWNAVRLGSVGVKSLHYYMQDRFYIQNDQALQLALQNAGIPARGLDRGGIRPAAFQYGSPEYEALSNPTSPDFNLAHLATVNRYLPGSTEYNALPDEAKRIVDSRNRMTYTFCKLVEGKRGILRNVPVPYLRGFIRRHVQEDYYPPFDPRRSDPIHTTTGPEMMRKDEWFTRQIIDGWQEHMNLIRTDANLPRLLEWYNGIAGNAANADFVRQCMLNVEINLAKVSLQMRINARKQYAYMEICKKYLYKHIQHHMRMGKKTHSVFWDSFNGFFGRMLAAGGYANEPTIGFRGPGLSPTWA